VEETETSFLRAVERLSGWKIREGSSNQNKGGGGGEYINSFSGGGEREMPQ